MKLESSSQKTLSSQHLMSLETALHLFLAEVDKAEKHSGALQYSVNGFLNFAGEKGSTALSTKPVILFCDLNLAPGESQTCGSIFLPPAFFLISLFSAQSHTVRSFLVKLRLLSEEQPLSIPIKLLLERKGSTALPNFSAFHSEFLLSLVSSCFMFSS